MDVALEASARFSHLGPVQMLGPLIHNPQALSHLSRRGIQLVNEAKELEDGTVIIRAHGVPMEDLSVLTSLRRNKQIRIINGTCPEVAKVQSLIRRQAAKGGYTIILGQAAHAEVEAHMSFASAGCDVVETLEEAKAIPQAKLNGALVVAQTTFAIQTFREIASWLGSRSSKITIRNTICPDTYLRQNEAEELARNADAIVVVGGRDSNNTRHLVELARGAGKSAQWVESAGDLDVEALRGLNSVGVLAGASTPNWTVDEVVEVLKQSHRPSRLQPVLRFLGTLQVAMALGLGVLAFLLHRLLEWPTGLSGPLLPAVFHLYLSATLPYLDPSGLDAKGQQQGRFLSRNRPFMLGAGVTAGGLAILASLSLGPTVLSGTVLLGVVAIAYQRRRLPGFVHRLPAIKDLLQAAVPALLVVGLPGLQGYPFRRGLGWMALAVSVALPLAAHGLRHVSAFREDRVLGREILPVVIGSKATRCMAAGMIILGTGLLAWMAHGALP